MGLQRSETDNRLTLDAESCVIFAFAKVYDEWAHYQCRYHSSIHDTDNSCINRHLRELRNGYESKNITE